MWGLLQLGSNQGLLFFLVNSLYYFCCLSTHRHLRVNHSSVIALAIALLSSTQLPAPKRFALADCYLTPAAHPSPDPISQGRGNCGRMKTSREAVSLNLLWLVPGVGAWVADSSTRRLKLRGRGWLSRNRNTMGIQKPVRVSRSVPIYKAELLQGNYTWNSSWKAGGSSCSKLLMKLSIKSFSTSHCQQDPVHYLMRPEAGGTDPSVPFPTEIRFKKAV